MATSASRSREKLFRRDYKNVIFLVAPNIFVTREEMTVMVEVMEESTQIKKLSALLEVSKALGSTLNIREAVEKVLEILDREVGMRRGAIALLEDSNNSLSIQYSFGLSEGERRRGRYKIDEGIT